jgi:hypothetical protein
MTITVMQSSNPLESRQLLMLQWLVQLPPCFLLNHRRHLPIPFTGVSTTAWFPFFSWFQLHHLHLNHFHMLDDPNHPNIRPPPRTRNATATTAISSCRFRGINRTHCESSSPQPRTLHQQRPVVVASSSEEEKEDNSRCTSQSLSSSAVSIASSSSQQLQQPSSSSRTWYRWWMYINPFRSSSSSVWDMWKLDASVLVLLVQRQHDEMVAQQILH